MCQRGSLNIGLLYWYTGNELKMMKQKAIVIAIDNTTIWLDAERQSICSKCQFKKFCNAKLLDNHIGDNFFKITVDKQINVAVGQQVQLSIPEQSLIQSAFIMYIIPLIIMFLLTVIAQLLNFSEAGEFIASICGLAIGFYLIHIQFQKNNKTDMQAKILEE